MTEAVPLETGIDRLRRDRETWLGYGLVGLFAYLLYSLGAATPYLKTELGLSDTVAGLHASAFALGAAGAGAVGERVAGKLGRDRARWLSAAAAALGGVGLTLLHNPLETLSSAFVIGLASSLLLALVNSSLTESHPRWSAVVLTEAQVVASICSLTTALIIGFAASGPLGWRAAMIVPIVAVAGLFAASRIGSRRYNKRLPDQPAERTPGSGIAAATTTADLALPAGFWPRWLVVVLVIGVEFSVVFWGPEILRVHSGLAAGAASASMGLFIGGMLVGRILGARLAASAMSSRLLPVGLALAGCGAFAAWLTPVALVSQLALGAIGLGVGNMYPQAVDAAIKSAPGRDVLAATRCSLAFGVALLFAPLLLGLVADGVGVVNGLWVVVAMCATALVLNGVPSTRPAGPVRHDAERDTIRH